MLYGQVVAKVEGNASKCKTHCFLYGFVDIIHNFYGICPGYTPFTWVPCVSCVTWAILAYLVCSVRTKLRSKDGIPGDNCNDFCCACWCLGCTLCQMGRHLFTYDGKQYQFGHPTGGSEIV